jgi:choline dehydrogenase-like flavoprotein
MTDTQGKVVSGPVTSADYLIVGGGSAGCVLAARLSENPDTQVILLEAGPPDTSAFIHCPGGLAALAHLTSLSRFLPSVPQAGLGGRRAAMPRGRVLGGCSSTNAMVYVRGHRHDYDAWAAMGNPGWGWDDVLPWFVRAERNARLGAPLHGQDGPLSVVDPVSPNPWSQRFVEAGVESGLRLSLDFNGTDQEGVGLYQVTQRQGERCSAAKAYLDPVRHRANLRVMTGVTVSCVGVRDGQAGGLLAWVDGQWREFLARREIILSAGAFQSPAILLRSGIGPARDLQSMGVKVTKDLPGVGANLHDHPDVVLVANQPRARDLFGLSLGGVGDLWNDVRQWRSGRRGRLTTNFAEAGAFLRTDPGLTQPDVQLHFVVAQLVDHGRRPVWGHGYSIHVCALQPHSRGRLRLSDVSPFSDPLIDPQYLSALADVQTLAKGVRAACRIMAQPALGANASATLWADADLNDTDLASWIRANADTIYHPVGTCRMGNDVMAVVDAQFKVHGVGGLRVVDASAMPRIVSGNTNAPVIMMAERAAHLIRQSGT